MRIGYFCNAFKKSGGMETYALGMIEAALELGHQPVVFCQTADYSIPFAEKCEIHEYGKKNIPNKIQTLLFHSWLKKESLKSNLDLSIGCCFGGQPDVIVCGGDRKGYLLAMNKPLLLWNRLFIKLEKEIFSNSKLIISHSKLVAQELVNLYSIEKERIHVIYPPQKFSKKSISVDKIALREKYKIPNDKRVFLFASMSHKRKGFDLLREHFQNSSSDNLLLVAGKPVKHEYKNIFSLGFCSEMDDLYQLSDYTILASQYEPFGLVGIESVLNGTPVIMSDNIGCCEVISPVALKTFQRSRPETLDKVIDDLKDNPIQLSQPYEQYISYPLNKTATDHLNEIIELTLH